MSLLVKPNFLKQHKTDLEQYSLAPTSTAKRSTHQPLDSMIAFKAKYLLILVPCQDSEKKKNKFNQINKEITLKYVIKNTSLRK